MNRLALLAAFAAAAFGIAACSPLSTGNVPVDSPMAEFEAPDEDDLDTANDEESWDLTDSGDPSTEPAPAADADTEPADDAENADAEPPAAKAKAPAKARKGSKAAKADGAAKQ